MIKVIKEGKRKEFYAICPFCHCEFTYEEEDLQDNVIKCPCCGAIMEAKANTKTWPVKDNIIYETPEYRAIQKDLKRQVEDPPSFIPCNNKINPCLTCPYYINLSQGKIYVGDSPCQWCQYSGLKITCTSTDPTLNNIK